MPAENIQEVKDYIEKNKESEDVKKFINGYNPITELTEENVNEFLNKTDILKSHYDKHVSKGIETYKENNKNDLDKIKADAIAEYVKKNYPEITEEQKRIKILEIKNKENEDRLKQGDILTTGIEYATANKIPIKLVKIVQGDSHELTQANLNKIKDIITEHEKIAVEAFIKGHGTKPGDGEKDINTLEKQYQEALTKGDTKTAIRLKREIAEQKNKK